MAATVAGLVDVPAVLCSEQINEAGAGCQWCFEGALSFASVGECLIFLRDLCGSHHGFRGSCTKALNGYKILCITRDDVACLIACVVHNVLPYFRGRVFWTRMTLGTFVWFDLRLTLLNNIFGAEQEKSPKGEYCRTEGRRVL